MTIAISCNLSDGVILGADSAITVSGRVTQESEGQPAKVVEGVMNIYHDADKLYSLGGEKAQIGILTYGAATLEKRTLRSYIRQFEGEDFDKSKNLEEICGDLGKFFEKILSPLVKETRPGIGLVVAGFSQDERLSEVWELKFPSGEEKAIPRHVRPRGSFGANWFATYKSITRLIKGYDEGVVNNLLNFFIKEFKVEMTTELSAKIQKEIAQILSAGEYRTIFDGMTLQDGISYVKFLLDTAINQSRFTIGPETCGGDVRIAVIDQDGFNDITHRELRI